jgi:hypothetical protein
MTEHRELDRRPAGTLIAIVGMCSEGDDVQLAVGGRRERPLRRRLLR